MTDLVLDTIISNNGKYLALTIVTTYSQTFSELIPITGDFLVNLELLVNAIDINETYTIKGKYWSLSYNVADQLVTITNNRTKGASSNSFSTTQGRQLLVFMILTLGYLLE